jgi:hypothetical protein
MSGPNTIRRPVLLAVAAAGLLAGHALTYLIAAPQADRRASLLAHSGHGYLGLITEPILAFAVVATIALFLRGLTRPAAEVRPGSVAVSLIALQCAGFLSMEIVERVASGAPLTPLLHAWILPVGLLAQSVLGALSGWILHLVVRAAEIVAEALGRRVFPQPTSVAVPSGRSFVPHALRAARAEGQRAPPLTASI